MKYEFEKFEKFHITSFVFNASKGGKINCRIFTKFITIIFSVLLTKSNIVEKVWEAKYIIKDVAIVIIFDMKLDKKNTITSIISSLKNIFIRDRIIKLSITISLINKTIKNNIDWNNVIKNIVIENHNIFQIINSYLLIGLLNIKNIVFHSISLNNNWLQTNKTHKSQKISIIANQKSTIIFESSHIVNFHSIIEKAIKINQKNTIIYKYLFLIISLKVFNAIFIINFN